MATPPTGPDADIDRRKLAAAEEFVGGRCAPLLRSMVAALALNQPEDHRAFMVRYLTERLDEVGDGFAEAAAGSAASAGAMPPAGESVAASAVLPPRVPVPGGIDDYEKDTDEREEVADLMALVLPDGKAPAARDKFAFSVSRKAFNGWVKQSSPACCAASVAGACNIVCGLDRDATGALDQDAVVHVMKHLMQEKIDAKIKSLTRMLGGCDMLPLLDAVRQALERDGKTLGGAKEEGTKAKAVVRLVRELAHQKMPGLEDEVVMPVSSAVEGEAAEGGEAGPDPAGSEWLYKEEVFVQLRMRYFEETAKQAAAAAEAGAAFKSDDDDGSDDGDDDDGGDPAPDVDASAGGAAVAFTIGGPTKKKKAPLWRRTMTDMFARIIGREKLCRERPSTAAFGNWGILDAVKTLHSGEAGVMAGIGMLEDPANTTAGADVRCRLFMGKKAKGSKVQVVVSAKDTAATIADQWAQLRSTFLREDTALIYHLKNHYALLFAMREWVDVETGEVVRQVLTSRRGQRPKAWIDFDEIRTLMLKWGGHKLMAIRNHGR